MKDPITQVGDPVLRKEATTVAPTLVGDKRTRAVIAHMKKALSAEEFGVAIAAPQIGESLRIFVVAGRMFLPEGHEDDRPAPPDKTFINPELMRLSRKKKEMSEGCLSVRGKYGSVLRHEKASVRALDEQGKPFIYHASGLLAQIFQHECDHLVGTLYIDKAVSLRDEAHN